MTISTPPTGRDFEIYRLRFVEGRSTRTVAEIVKLSQTRVCQIADKMGRYLTAVAPANDAESRERQLTVAEQVASLRISFLYGAALDSWRSSQGTQTTTRLMNATMQPPVTITTTRQSFGEPRYLMLAARLAIMSSRLPAAVLEWEGVADDDATTSPSPVGDCSPDTADCSKNVAFAANEPTVNHVADSSYDRIPDAAEYAQRKFFAPVHPEPTEEDDDRLPFPKSNQSRPLTRRERRARQRYLERKMNSR